MKILLLILIIIISIPSSIYSETNLTIGNSALIMEGSQFVAIQAEMDVFYVTDSGGEVFRVTDGGGQAFNVRQ